MYIIFIFLLTGLLHINAAEKHVKVTVNVAQDIDESGENENIPDFIQKINEVIATEKRKHTQVVAQQNTKKGKIKKLLRKLKR